MKKRILSLFLIVIMSLCLCACGNDSSSSSDENGLPKVTLGTTSWPTNMFFYLAKEKRLFLKKMVLMSQLKTFHQQLKVLMLL